MPLNLKTACARLRVAALDGRAALALASAFLLLQLFFLDRIKVPNFRESLFSEVAYHLNLEFNGRMAPDLPWGVDWSLGIGRIFLLVQNLVYHVFGLGIYSCRLVSYACNLLQLLLLYRWVRAGFDLTSARLSAFFLAISSPLWYFTVPDGSTTAMFGLFAFPSLLYLSRALLAGRARDAFGAGLCCGLAVDVHYRCVFLVLVTWAALLLSKRRGEPRLWFALGAGSLLALVWWVSLNILPVGLDNFLTKIVPMALSDGGAYTWETLLSEFRRFTQFAERWPGSLDFSLWLLLIPLALWKFGPRREQRPLAVLLQWLALIFLVFSILERAVQRELVLLYAPYLSVLSALGFRRLSERFPAWSMGLGAAILLAVVAEYGGLLYMRRNLDSAAYYQKLRATVRPGSVVLGAVPYWYAFPDQPYFAGEFYLARLALPPEKLKTFKGYSGPSELYAAFLDILKKRNIEFVIGCEHFIWFLEHYSPGGVLPPKNFALVTTIEDPFLGKRQGWGKNKPPYKTRIYRLVSYDP